MRRLLVTSLVPAAVVCVSWLRIEDPPRPGEAFLVAGLALAASLLPRWRLRLPAVAAAALGVVWIAFAFEPWELLPGRDEAVLDPFLESLSFGVGDFYGVVLPFDPVRHPEMASLVLVAIFAFVAALALLLAAGRRFAAAAVATAGICWPATLLDAGAAAIGVLALAAVLWIFLAGRAHSVGTLATGLAASCAVIAGAAWISTATSFARDAALEWESWDFRGAPARALGVRFVWNASYDGVRFPPTKTVVLEIRGPDRPQYWRASTLNVFTADRWIEDLYPTSIDSARQREIPRDVLSPPRADDRSTWLEQRVVVKALVDDRVVAAGVPVALDGPALGTLFFLSGGVVRARHELDPGTRYRVWSYVPDPSPAELAAVPARYPPRARRFLEVWGRALPPFAAPRRDLAMSRLLAHEGLGAYRPVYEEARRLARGSRSPYRAVLRIESWLRRSGGFRYEEQPVQTRDLPPLVEFVTVTKAGYCQHFAGAMAVMLRLLGIPARVAVGFTSGTHEDGKWRVTDHDAHAWVEVWFPGYGWVPFDPTPGRGTFAGTYSYASENAQAVAALDRGGTSGDPSAFGGRRGGSSAVGARGGERDAAPSIVGIVLLLAALWVLAVTAVKWGRRRMGRLARDPRRVATATRRELEAFLRDQRVEIPPSATLAWLQRAARDELGIDADAFAAAAARARFGPPSEAASAAGAAREELHALINEARRRLSPWARIRGLLSLRSLRGGYA